MLVDETYNRVYVSASSHDGVRPNVGILTGCLDAGGVLAWSHEFDQHGGPSQFIEAPNQILSDAEHIYVVGRAAGPDDRNYGLILKYLR